MDPEGAWEFRDDRGRLATAPRRPAKVVAYIQPGAALWDHGIRPAGLFGSAHDGAAPDPAKAGTLPLDDIPYFGSGAALDEAALLAADPDLVIAVTYDGDGVYGIDADAAKRLEARVPLVALDVSGRRPLTATRERLTALAHALGAATPAAAEAEVGDAERLLRAAAEAPGAPRALALSPAGEDLVHLARPGSWPDLAAVAGLGVALCEPPPGAGLNWATTDWPTAAALNAPLWLVDARANAAPLPAHLAAGIRVLPWNPELPPSPRAHAHFHRTLAEALRAAAD
ncbi:ABC transporter substrate-binding protein [Streptomyces litchfieldiae]|uniref:ABC transporter substrate-binding protein n=1 Tax=Streptomyces litchfieldiae TaxID=3075543 RepID=A0ABU2MIA2_9ACTN|nr:ABC transporter substrate-binding protein [Streptomyces sp. DSM 44938]MDT0341315.1 ABC transporter substrate-binding protein [Streptomyces sp. DSM 44938]